MLILSKVNDRQSKSLPRPSQNTHRGEVLNMLFESDYECQETNQSNRRELGETPCHGSVWLSWMGTDQEFPRNAYINLWARIEREMLSWEVLLVPVLLAMAQRIPLKQPNPNRPDIHRASAKISTPRSTAESTVNSTLQKKVLRLAASLCLLIHFSSLSLLFVYFLVLLSPYSQLLLSSSSFSSSSIIFLLFLFFLLLFIFSLLSSSSSSQCSSSFFFLLILHISERSTNTRAQADEQEIPRNEGSWGPSMVHLSCSWPLLVTMESSHMRNGHRKNIIFHFRWNVLHFKEGRKVAEHVRLCIFSLGIVLLLGLKFGWSGGRQDSENGLWVVHKVLGHVGSPPILIFLLFLLGTIGPILVTLHHVVLE